MADSQIPFNIAELAGPQLLGHLFNWGLYGVLTVQVYIYYLSFPSDARFIKCIVYGLYFIETVQTMLATHDAFATLGAGWGSLAALNNPQWLWFSVPVLSGLISASVQIFFAWRISLLSKSKLLGIAISVIALMQGTAAMATGILVHSISDIAVLQVETFKSTSVWLAGSAACDVIIAVCMVTFLAKNQTGYASTDLMLSRIIRLTIETGTVTASVATLDLILFLTFQHNNLHMCPALTLAKLYSNTLLAIFNNRMRIVGGRASQRSGAQSSRWDGFTGSPNVHIQPHGASAGTGAHGLTGINVEVSTDTRGDDVAMINIGDDKSVGDSESAKERADPFSYFRNSAEDDIESRPEAR